MGKLILVSPVVDYPLASKEVISEKCQQRLGLLGNKLKLHMENPLPSVVFSGSDTSLPSAKVLASIFRAGLENFDFHRHGENDYLSEFMALIRLESRCEQTIVLVSTLCPETLPNYLANRGYTLAVQHLNGGKIEEGSALVLNIVREDPFAYVSWSSGE